MFLIYINLKNLLNSMMNEVTIIYSIDFLLESEHEFSSCNFIDNE